MSKKQGQRNVASGIMAGMVIVPITYGLSQLILWVMLQSHNVPVGASCLEDPNDTFCKPPTSSWWMPVTADWGAVIFSVVCAFILLLLPFLVWGYALDIKSGISKYKARRQATESELVSP